MWGGTSSGYTPCDTNANNGVARRHISVFKHQHLLVVSVAVLCTNYVLRSVLSGKEDQTNETSFWR